MGSNAYAFKMMSKELSENNIQMYGVSFPGRNGKNTDLMYPDLQTLIDATEQEFMKNKDIWGLMKVSSVFFGHSFGGLVAFELARRFEMNTSFSPRKVVVSAVKNPVDLTQANREVNATMHHKQSDDELFRYIDSIGGLPKGIDPMFLTMSLPTIKADYKVFETYDEINFPEDKLKCDFSVFIATDDASLPTEMVSRWSKFSANPASVKSIEFKGGSHFYFNDVRYKSDFIQKVKSECLELL